MWGCPFPGALCLPDAFHPATDPIPEAVQVHLLVGEAEVQRHEVAGPPSTDSDAWKHLCMAASFLGVQGHSMCVGMGTGPGGFSHPLSLRLLTTSPVAVSVQPRGPVVLQQ